MARFNYLIILVSALFLTFCSGQSDQELFDSANAKLSEKNYDEALILFEELVSNNSDSDLAPKALFECAKLYQGQVLKNLGSKESLVKSVQVYKSIFEKYPNYMEAGNSLFMAGFILANDLQDFDSAKETYELYLEKYPNGQLADDARVELENLGKTPEEILLEKIKTDQDDETAI
jgi:TolA-binding protein